MMMRMVHMNVMRRPNLISILSQLGVHSGSESLFLCALVAWFIDEFILRWWLLEGCLRS